MANNESLDGILRILQELPPVPDDEELSEAARTILRNFAKSKGTPRASTKRWESSTATHLRDDAISMLRMNAIKADPMLKALRGSDADWRRAFFFLVLREAKVTKQTRIAAPWTTNPKTFRLPGSLLGKPEEAYEFKPTMLDHMDPIYTQILKLISLVAHIAIQKYGIHHDWAFVILMLDEELIGQHVVDTSIETEPQGGPTACIFMRINPHATSEEVVNAYLAAQRKMKNGTQRRKKIRTYLLAKIYAFAVHFEFIDPAHPNWRSLMFYSRSINAKGELRTKIEKETTPPFNPTDRDVYNFARDVRRAVEAMGGPKIGRMLRRKPIGASIRESAKG